MNSNNLWRAQSTELTSKSPPMTALVRSVCTTAMLDCEWALNSTVTLALLLASVLDVACMRRRPAVCNTAQWQTQPWAFVAAAVVPAGRVPHQGYMQ